MKKSKLKNIIKILLLLLIGLATYYIIKNDLSSYFTLDYIKENQLRFNQYYQQHPSQTIVIFFAIYVISIAFSVPGAAVLTLLAGAIFGFLYGTLIVSFASSIGATLAFLVSRFVLRDTIEKKFNQSFKKINQGVEQKGASFLLMLRLVPIFPFFLINLVMGVTKMNVFTFYWVSQVGMILGTMVYVNAGYQLSSISNLKDILSLPILTSLIIIALFPFIIPKVVKSFQNRKNYRKYTKPKSFDYNLAIIGGGSAGLVSGYIAATVKAKVVLIEKHKMGGDCLNTGCVPSKALIRSAKTISEMKKAEKMGIEKVKYEVNFKKVMSGIQRVIKKIEPHDSMERYRELGVECIHETATILSPWEILVGEGDDAKVIKTKSIIVATGARPFEVPLKNIGKIKPLNSDNVWKLTKLPKKLVVLGGGPIGCELTQAFSTLGSEVTQVEMGDRIMKVEDKAISTFVSDQFKKQGIKILTNHRAEEILIEKNKKYLLARHNDKMIRIEFDEILVAVGRKANVTGFGLEKLGIQLRPNGTIEANEFLETNYPNIFVCGDVTGPYQFTHTAAHQAWFASVNALFGRFKKFKVDYRVVPWCTFTQPEIASVGLNEQRAIEEGIEYELTTYGLDDLDRAIADRDDEGFIRVLTPPQSDKILGVTIAGSNASILILEFISAMKHKYGLNKILSTIHIYPSLGEANKYLAGNWKKKHAPEKLLRQIEKYHRWVRK